MRTVFVAYADNKMAYSLKRIGRQAENLKFFDKIKLYTPEDLPDDVKEWDLMKYSYGGGYWAWKPYIIWQTLQEEPNGTIVFYVDAGCSLKKGFEWAWLARLAKKYKTVFFEYKSEMSEWEKFGSVSSTIKFWTKKDALEYYDSFVGKPDWKEKNKIWGGCLIVTEKHNVIIKEWLNIMKNHPEIIIDPQKEDIQMSYFAQHKHDQSLLVALSSKYPNKCIVLPEFQESFGEDVSIFASRIRAKTFGNYLFDRIKYYIRKSLGQSNYNLIKKKIIK